jgi:hypothetical protein
MPPMALSHRSPLCVAMIPEIPVKELSQPLCIGTKPMPSKRAKPSSPPGPDLTCLGKDSRDVPDFEPISCVESPNATTLHPRNPAVRIGEPHRTARIRALGDCHILRERFEHGPTPIGDAKYSFIQHGEPQCPVAVARNELQIPSTQLLGQRNRFHDVVFEVRESVRTAEPNAAGRIPIAGRKLLSVALPDDQAVADFGEGAPWRVVPWTCSPKRPALPRHQCIPNGGTQR